jgi:hypothetical protein
MPDAAKAVPPLEVTDVTVAESLNCVHVTNEIHYLI